MSKPSKADLAAYDRSQKTGSYLELYVAGGALLGLLAGFAVESNACVPKEPGFLCHQGYTLLGLGIGGVAGLFYGRSTIS